MTNKMNKQELGIYLDALHEQIKKDTGIEEVMVIVRDRSIEEFIAGGNDSPELIKDFIGNLNASIQFDLKKI